MAVRIRLKQLGRKHRPYYRICVMDSRVPRGGKAIEEIGTYDPMIRDTDQRVTLNAERYDYWVGVGAQATDNVKRLADKYKGKVPAVRMDEPKAREAIATPEKAEVRRRKPEPPPEEAPAEAAAEAPVEGAEASAEAAPAEATEAPAEAAGETAPAEPAAEGKAEEPAAEAPAEENKETPAAES